jgi:hypothetical protein
MSASSPIPETAEMPASSRLLAHWILFCVSCNIAGWTLSIFGWLHPVGFLVFIPTLHFILAKLSRIGFSVPRFGGSFRWKGRYRRLLPAGFLVIALLALLGGVLHAPNNMDALHGRMPRVAHWLMAERWEWFPANNNSQNTRSAGFEWMTAPLISLTGSDRLIFVFNLIPFLFMPGICFGVFRGMGVSRRASWAWMWLAPAGYCFALQSGGVGNDLTAAVFAIAAFDYAFRWRRSRSFPCFAIAMAACSLMTAVKPSTLPLFLPFVFLFFGMWKTALLSPLRTAVLLCLLAIGSFLPTAIMNIRHCGDWTGLKAENQAFAQVEPLIGIQGNLINATLQNLAPPVLPGADHVSSFVLSRVSVDFQKAMLRSFEPTGAVFGLPEIQGEEWAGLGAGITYLVLLALLLSSLPGKASGEKTDWRTIALLLALFGAALLFYFAKTGLFTVARHISVYYVFFIGIALLGAKAGHVVRRKIWMTAALCAMLTTAVMLVITPSRPLWPANWVFSKIPDEQLPPPLRQLKFGYSIYAERADALGRLRQALPESAETVGFISFSSGSEMPFWKPYGKRAVRHVLPADSITKLRSEGMTHIALNTRNFAFMMGADPEKWALEHDARILFRDQFRITVQEEPSEWLLLALTPLPD